MASEITINEVIQELGLSKGKNKGDYTEYYCPVHDNNTPDLAVYHDDFTCYSGGREGGGPISLIMHAEQMNDVSEAINWIQTHFPDKDISSEDEETLERRKKARQVLNKASELAQSELKNHHQDLYNYIKENRNFDGKTMEEAGIGFFSRSIVETLKQRYSKQVLLDTGLFYEKDSNIRCQMWRRIVFPYERGDQVWYMIGRKPGDHEEVPMPYREFLEKSQAKYKKLNKTEYNKHIVYQWQQGENSDEVIITEGITDAISAHRAGYNVSSPVTVQYSQKDIERVCGQAKHYDKVFIAMDADGEGWKGAKKTGHELAKQGIEARIVDLGEGDLDDYTTENGYNIETLLQEAERYIDILDQELSDADRDKVTEKKERIFEAIQNWSEARRIRILSNISDGTKTENKTQFKKWLQSTEQTEQTEQTEGGTHIESFEREKNSGEQNMLKKLAKQTTTRKQRLAGEINDTYFLTAWIEDKGLEKPAIITSNDNISYIKHKLKEVKSTLPEDTELTEEQIEKYDFWYATVNGEEVKFQHEIPKKSKQAINNLDNQILKYVTGMKEERSAEEIFDDAKELISNYWSHYHDEWYDISVAYNIHTFLLPVTGYTVYILLKGRPQTGKTTWQKVNSMLNYNGCFAGNLTPATAVRYAHSYFATLHQDEMEKQSEERRNQMQGLYNTGQRKGGVYNITNTDGGENVADQIQEIQSFCSKSMSVNDIFGFADSFMSRNVILKTVKTKEKGLLDPDSMSEEEYMQFRDLQAEIAYYVLQNYDDILDTIDDVRHDIQDTARDEDKMALFKGLVQHFKGEERASLVEERIRDSQRMQEVSQVGERITSIFETISGEFKTEDGKLVQIRATDLADSVNDKLGLSSDDEYSASSKSVLRNLKEYDIVRRSNQKKKDSSGYTTVEVELREFLDACDRYEMSSIYADLVASGSRDVLTEGSDSDDGDDDDGESSLSKESLSVSPSQSAQSAQFAQSNSRKAPDAQQILRKIKEWYADPDKGYDQGVDLTDLEDYFVEAYGDYEKVRKKFVKNQDSDRKAGVAKLLNNGQVYDPGENGKLKPL